jgi:hypothetical protein
MAQKVISHIRISTDKKNLEKQRHFLLEYAWKQRLIVIVTLQVFCRTSFRIDSPLAGATSLK